MKWSPSQQAVFEDAEHGTGHTVVLARAGSGKSTTIIEALRRLPTTGRTLLVAFNKAIKQEMEQKAPRHVLVKTLHGYGFGAVRRSLGRNVRLDRRKPFKLLDDSPYGGSLRFDHERDVTKAITKLVSLCKATLVDDPNGMARLLSRFNIEVDAEDDFLIEVATWLLNASTERTETIDFDDMAWLPLRLKLSVQQFDRVFVDETQDLNACQLELVQRALLPGGRICAVGDDRQAIYNFRGADPKAVQRIIEGLGAKVLPLSTTYRCDRAIVREAQAIVADIEAAEGAAEGIVRKASEADMLDQVGPGDFILSRTNAPLVKHCLALIAQNRRANIAGRDIGTGLAKLVKKSKADDLESLRVWLNGWVSRECARKRGRDPEAPVQDIEDQAECLHVIADGTRSVPELLAKIEALFSDADNQALVLLSSTHKAKGLERKRVFLLRDTYLRRRCEGDEQREEENLYYVAVTRAKHELVLVEG